MTTTSTTTYVLQGGARTRLYHLTVDPTAQQHIPTEHGYIFGDMTPDAPALPALCGKDITDAIVMDLAHSNNPSQHMCKKCAARHRMT